MTDPIKMPSWFTDALLLMARLSIASVFWLSGQTKITGFALSIFPFHWHWGWPQLADGTLYLFEHEYALPLIPPLLAAWMAAIAEHLCSILLVIGWQTRIAVLILGMMTLVIQIFVYPLAYATHGTWLSLLLFIFWLGAGRFSLDAWRSGPFLFRRA
ncbi:DoxX family protein [Celerinatantimonas sp. YJH-8]|uniref:DoxX family protein n=1 Tax=Celerinatantimonas sp. YJH-8 TaxID=3228714 RepID=UPI0038C74105